MPTSKADLEEKGSLKESQIKLFPFSYEQLVEKMSIQGVDLTQFPIVPSFGREFVTWNGGVCDTPYLDLKGFQIVRGMIDNRNFIAYLLPDNTQVTLIETLEKDQLPVVIKISKTPKKELVAQQLPLDEIAKELIYATRSKEEVAFYPKELIEAFGRAKLEALPCIKREKLLVKKYPQWKELEENPIIRGVDPEGYSFITYKGGRANGALTTFFAFKEHNRGILQSWKRVSFTNERLASTYLLSPQTVLAQDLEEVKTTFYPVQPQAALALPSVQYLPSKTQLPKSTSVRGMHSVFPPIFLNDGRELMRLPFLRLNRGIRAEGTFHGEKHEYYHSLKLQDCDVYDLIRGVDVDNRHFISFKSYEDGKTYIHTYFELEPCTPEFSNWKIMKVDVTKTLDCVWGISLRDMNEGDLKELSNRMNPKLRYAPSMRTSPS